MELEEVDSISFLDLSDVDDQEQRRILSTLHAPNTCVQLPWTTTTTPPLPSPPQITAKSVLGPPIEFTTNSQQQQQQQHATTLYRPPLGPPAPPPPYAHIPYYVVAASPFSPVTVVTAVTPHQVPVPYTPNYVPSETVTVDSASFVAAAAPSPLYVSTTPTVSLPPASATQQPSSSELKPTAIAVTTTITQQNGMADGGEMDQQQQQQQQKSWASLFSGGRKISETDGNSNGSTETIILKTPEVKAVNTNEDLSPITHPRLSKFTDPHCYRMAEFLQNHIVDGKTVSLQPRGLINHSNYCYINSILQALLACPPVYNLLSGLAKQNSINDKQRTTPIIDGMCRFVKQFQHQPAVLRVGRRTDKSQKKEQSISIDYDNPFEPSWIYKLLNGVRTDSFLVEGRQEDAEEFLGCLLNGLNDEMIELMKLLRTEMVNNVNKEKIIENEHEKEWQVMGPKNKGAITRQTDLGKTPISDIFGGTLKSRIHRTGDQSTYNIQPFFTLQLNIEKVKTVREALEALVIKNQLEGVTSSKTNEEVEAWQQVTLEDLPVILILHLKCFDFKLDGCTKIIKALEFPIDLKIDSKLLSKPIPTKEKQYKLFAVVYHDGKEATKGHYITDAFHVGYNSWIRYDDAAVKVVLEEQVLKPQGTRVPYLLFYRRSDTIRSK